MVDKEIYQYRSKFAIKKHREQESESNTQEKFTNIDEYLDSLEKNEKVGIELQSARKNDESGKR